MEGACSPDSFSHSAFFHRKGRAKSLKTGVLTRFRTKRDCYQTKAHFFPFTIDIKGAISYLRDKKTCSSPPLHKNTMKTFLSALFITLFCGFASADNGTLLIEGKYQNKNIYIQNSFSSSGVGFCAYEVRVNGERSTDEVNSSAFEIDLRNYNLKEGDAVEIQIFHKEGCSPRVLNPEVLKPRPTFETKSITCSQSGMISWTTNGETSSIPFIIEQFRWNKWVYVGEVQGLGTPGEHTYNFQATTHSGENKFRVKQVGFGKEVKYTPEVKVTPANTAPVTFTQSSDSKKISLSGDSMYEMFDSYGNIVLKGYGRDIDISSFEKGIYFLCFDNKIEQIERK